jgi:hypothetical protein
MEVMKWGCNEVKTGGSVLFNTLNNAFIALAGHVFVVVFGVGWGRVRTVCAEAMYLYSRLSLYRGLVYLGSGRAWVVGPRGGWGGALGTVVPYHSVTLRYLYARAGERDMLCCNTFISLHLRFRVFKESGLYGLLVLRYQVAWDNVLSCIQV